MSQKTHVMHGRDHGPTGADPIPGIGGGGGGGITWEDVGVITTLALAARHVSFAKTIASWAPGTWTGALSFATGTIIHTNDVDGSENSWNTNSGPAVFTGSNYSHNGTVSPTLLNILRGGLYHVQLGVSLSGAPSPDFDIGFGTQAGRSSLFDGYPTLWARYSSTVANAGGASQGSISVHRTAYLTGATNVDLNVWHNASATLANAVVILSYAKLELH